MRAAALVARHERATLAGVLVAGFLIRIPFVATDQHVSGDPQLLVGWAEHLRLGGWSELLSATGHQVLYPPISTLAIWLAGSIGGILSGWVPPTQTELVFIKGIAIAGDLGLAWLVARMLHDRGPAVRLAGAAAIAFNPAFWYLSTMWGQIDSVLALLMIASVAAIASDGKPAAWASWVAAVSWKLQALALGPLVVVRTLRGVVEPARGRIRRIGLPTLGPGATLAVAPLAGATLVVGWMGTEYLRRLWPGTSLPDVSAFNLWYLAAPDLVGGRSPSEHSLDVALSIIGWLLVVAVTALAVIGTWRRPTPGGFALAGATLALAAFSFLAGMHERYLLPAIPLTLLLAAGWEHRRVDASASLAFVALTATQVLNLVAVGSFAPDLWTNVFGTSTGLLGPVIATLGSLAAAVNLIVLGWFVSRLVRLARPG